MRVRARGYARGCVRVMRDRARHMRVRVRAYWGGGGRVREGVVDHRLVNSPLKKFTNMPLISLLMKRGTPYMGYAEKTT